MTALWASTPRGIVPGVKCRHLAPLLGLVLACKAEFGQPCEQDKDCERDLACARVDVSNTRPELHQCTVACSTDQDCPDDARCHSAGVCFATCENAQTCPEGTACLGDTCVLRCAGPEDCVGGLPCVDEICQAP